METIALISCAVFGAFVGLITGFEIAFRRIADLQAPMIFTIESLLKSLKEKKNVNDAE